MEYQGDESYKQDFLSTAQNARNAQEKREQQIASDLAGSQMQFSEPKEHVGQLTKITNSNDIWASSQYSGDNWRKTLQTSYYNNEHNEGQFGRIVELNPELKEGPFNMRITRISEYSNALHNNRIFVNPKFTSC